MLFYSLDSKECFNSTNNLNNKALISMLVTNSEELILNSRLMKEVKFRKWKSSIIEQQEVLCNDKSGFVTELSYF